MSVVLCVGPLIAACVCTAWGAVRLGGWLTARRDAAASRPIRDAAFVAQARAELSATSWTRDDEDAYQRSRAREREIAASKRGHSLKAAHYAPMQESPNA